MRKIKKPKFIKSLYLLGGVSLVSLTSIIIASCSSQGTNKGYFLPVANDVYSELKMAAKTLDDAGYKPKDPNTNFQEKANQENEKLKTLINNLSNKLKEQKLVNEQTTALFLKNYDFNYSNDKNVLLKNLNNFSMEQPILYSQLYDSNTIGTNDGLPNLGIKFPTPLNNSGMQYFDNWWEIGAAEKNPNTGNLLAKNWKGTADYVFYLYDSTNITEAEENTLKNFIFTKMDNNFTPWTLFKDSSPLKRVIPVDLQYFYNGTWDLIGTKNIVEQFSLILAAMNEENLNDDKLTIDENKVKANAKFQAIKTEIDKQIFDPLKLTENDKLTAPSDNGGLINLGSSGFNSLGHLITLGVLPNYVEYNADPATAKRNIFYSGYLQNLMPDNPNKDTMLPLGFGKNANTSENIAFAKTAKLYTVLADRSRYGSVASNWTFENPIINSNSPTANGLGNLMNQNLLKKATFTERNDSSLTQKKLTSGFILFDTINKKTISQNEYSKKNEYI